MSRHKLAIIHLNIITRGDKTIALRIENTHFYWDFLSSRRGWRKCKRCSGSHKNGRFNLLPQIHSYTERSFHRIDDRNRSTRIAAPSVSITLTWTVCGWIYNTLGFSSFPNYFNIISPKIGNPSETKKMG